MPLLDFYVIETNGGTGLASSYFPITSGGQGGNSPFTQLMKLADPADHPGLLVNSGTLQISDNDTIFHDNSTADGGLVDPDGVNVDQNVIGGTQILDPNAGLPTSLTDQSNWNVTSIQEVQFTDFGVGSPTFGQTGIGYIIATQFSETLGLNGGSDGLIFAVEKGHGISALSPDVTYSMVSTDGFRGEVDYSALFCLTRGAIIEAEHGLVAVEDIRAGDKLKCIDGEYRPVRLALNTRRTLKDFRHNEKLRPIRITAGALGDGLPRTDMLVSRQHRIMIESETAKRVLGESRVLVPAIKLTELPGIFIDQDVADVEYFHLVMDTHEIIFADGVPNETLLIGPEVKKTVSEAAAAELVALFPDIFAGLANMEPAALIPTHRAQKELVREMSLETV